MIHRSYGEHHYHSLREEYMDKQLKGLMKEEWGKHILLDLWLYITIMMTRNVAKIVQL